VRTLGQLKHSWNLRLPLDYITLVVSGLLCSVFLIWPILEFDFWWHLANGRDILATLSIPHSDKFSFTIHGSPWIDFEWLFQVGAYILADFWGLRSLIYIKALLVCFGLYLTSRNVLLEGGDWRLALLGFWFSFLLVRTRAFERPEIITILLLPIFLNVIIKTRQDGRWRRLFVLPFLMLIWVNSHGGFILGLGLLALSIAGLALESHLYGGKNELVAFYAVSLFACFVVTFINPYGYHLYQVLLIHTVQGAEAARLVDEWRILKLSQYPCFWVFLIMAFVMLIRDVFRKRRNGIFWIPLILIFGFWATRHVRNPGLYVLVTSPYVFGSLNFPSEIFSRWVRRFALGISLVIVYLFMSVLSGQNFRNVVMWFHFPKGAADFVDREHIYGRMYNTYEYGGYWEWRFGTGRPVFFDGRYIFLPLLQTESKTMSNPDLFDQWLKDYLVTYVVVKHTSQPVIESSPGRKLKVPRSPWAFYFPRREWALVYWDDTALLFLRRTKIYQATIGKYGYEMPDPDDIDLIVEGIREGFFKKRKILLELKRHSLETPGCQTDRLILERIKDL